jgi:chromosome segregation ATPase
MESGRGNHETQRLKTNIEDQLNRLLTQLQDIDDNREDFEDENEYQENRNDTIQQMKEFEISLHKMKEGNMTLVDDIGKYQLAIQDAIRTAFKSPEVMKMFAKRENGALRTRLNTIQQDHRLGKISSDDYLMMSAEIIGALEKLGEPLEPHERLLLENVIYFFLILFFFIFS